jgi:FkbM family methyltransferase
MLPQLCEKASDRTPRVVKEFVRTAATRVGCAIGRLPGIELLGTHLRTLFPALGIDCVLDVGAHRGHFARFLRNIGYRGLIVSFEPEPENYRHLRAAAERAPNWRALSFALGERNGTASFNVAHVSQFSSFLEPSAYSHEQFGLFSDTARVISVQMRRLDSVIEELVGAPEARGIFLKMDTQGYDMNVLDGSTETLQLVRGVQTEVSVKALYDHMVPYDVAITRMQSFGFELTGLFPVTRDNDLRGVEFDCVMRRLRDSGAGNTCGYIKRGAARRRPRRFAALKGSGLAFTASRCAGRRSPSIAGPAPTTGRR